MFYDNVIYYFRFLDKHLCVCMCIYILYKIFNLQVVYMLMRFLYNLYPSR